MLCASIIRFLKAGNSSTVFYYFCNNYRSSGVDNIGTILRCFCFQALETRSTLSAVIYDDYVREDKPPSIQNMLRILQTLFSSFDSVRLVVDGLDEWEPGKSKRVLSELIALLHWEDDSSRKLLISSRDVLHMNRVLFRKKTLSLSDEKAVVDGALKTYIHNTISHIFDDIERIHGDVLIPQLRDEIEDKLLKKANGTVIQFNDTEFIADLLGMFLWVRLVLNTLENAWTIRELKEAVDSFPKELGELYSQILGSMKVQLSQNDYTKALRVLGWLAFSKRSLRSYELQHAVALHSNAPVLRDDTKLLRSVSEICKPLVESGPQQTVVLIHSSVRE